MRTIALKISILVITTLSVRSYADLLIEPYAGYHSGKIRNNNSTEGVAGVTYGGRVGIEHTGLMAGVDYMTGEWNDDEDPKSDQTPKSLGFFLGYNFPNRARIYGVYYYDAKIDIEYDNQPTDPKDEYTGTAVKVGIGFMAMQKLAINFEYVSAKIDEIDGGKLTYDIKPELLGITVSLPLTF